MPPAPLDLLIDKLGGPQKVAEMTGRSQRVVRKRAGGGGGGSHLVLEHRTGKHLNIVERAAFQSGKKLVGIISDAASTGVSLHADKRVKSCGKRRLHITIELPWTADKAVQQFGRSHRSNQESAPRYCLLCSPEIAGERRLTAAMANRLNELGATLHGDRNASAGGNDLSSFNLDRQLSDRAINKYMLPDLKRKSQQKTDNVYALSFITPEYTMLHFAKAALSFFQESGILEIHESDQKISLEVYLNRLFNARPLALQTEIFEYFAKILEIFIRDAKASGTFFDGVIQIAGI
jgi:hypothetical protein